jgi:hypothetical protein
VVVGQGFEPCRSSPSGQSPRFIKPRRIPMLPTIFNSSCPKAAFSSSQDQNAVRLKCKLATLWFPRRRVPAYKFWSCSSKVYDKTHSRTSVKISLAPAAIMCLNVLYHSRFTQLLPPAFSSRAPPVWQFIVLPQPRSASHFIFVV